jgi:2-amino-4-hydroxy-6-hydroxymethyldihydropteridine diphosphokinase
MVTYLGLGSNVGDRKTELQNAVASLGLRGIIVTRSASLYLTEPRGLVDQPWFLNTVVEANTTLKPRELLEACLAIERAAGRVRDLPQGPRPIDVDILLYDHEVVDAPDLTIPHPRYADRRFVLVPLVELQPDLRDPLRNLTMRELLDICPDAGEVRVYAPPLR